MNRAFAYPTIPIRSSNGHINAGLGVVMTMQGFGAALSASVAGVAAERLGYAAAFMVLGGFALLALWVLARAASPRNAATACSGPPISIECLGLDGRRLIG